MESSSHLERIMCHCGAIAARMGLDGDLVGAASRLHDVGMDHKADRPAPLSAAERQALLDHPRAGHRMLAGSRVDAFEVASQIALTHHERFDGGGYPQALRGSSIPLPGRIMAVADTFDALTTDRVYRAAGTVADAVATLLAERGHQLDPDVVSAFLGGLDGAVEVLERHPGEPEIAPPEDSFLTVDVAARMLRMSPSRVRRLADSGALETRRTPGGHRRFLRHQVQRLAAQAGVHPEIRPLAPPTGAIPPLARLLRTDADAITAAVVDALYREGPVGWFAADAAYPALGWWADTLASAAASGDYRAAVSATDRLMRQAHTYATTQLERHLFLEAYANAVAHRLRHEQTPRPILIASRRVFVALQQALLA